MNGFIRWLVLIQRQKATRKWPIYRWVFAVLIHYQLHVMHSIVSPKLGVSLLLVWFCQHRKGVGVVDSLTLDVDDELLYWTDVSYQNIQRADLDGGNRRTIVKGLDKPRAIILYKARRLVNSPILLVWHNICPYTWRIPIAGSITSRCSEASASTPPRHLKELPRHGSRMPKGLN